MFDPITISASLGIASQAFSNIKRMFQAGRDIEAMSQDLSRWMGAVSDVDNAHKSAKNPSMLRKVFGGGSVDQEAIEAFTAKKKLEAQRQELKSFINFHYGANSWNEILHMEAEIRKKRQKMVYEQQERRQRVIEGIAITGLIICIFGFVGFIGYLYYLIIYYYLLVL